MRMLSDPHTIFRGVLIGIMTLWAVTIIGYATVNLFHRWMKWYYDWENLT